MSQLMLVNPRKRRTAKQKAATRRLVASNRARKGGRGRSVTKSRTVKTATTRRRNPIRRRGLMNRVIETTQDGAIGSVGAIAGSIVGGYLPLPLNLKTGNMAIVVNALVGIGTGFGVSKFMNRKFGEKMAQGAVTVALHGAMKTAVGGMLPGISLAGDDSLLGYEESLLGYNDMNDDLSAYDLSAYDDDSGMGYSGAGYTGEDVGTNLDEI